MRSRSVFLVVLLSALFAVPASARAGYLALVPDSSSGGASWVAGIDTDTNQRTEYVQTAVSSVFGAAIAPDGRTAYLVGTGSHNMTTVDLTKTPIAPGPAIALYGDPTSIAIAPDGRKAYLAEPTFGEVIVVDLTGSAPTLARTIVVGHKPHGIAFTPDGTRALVANFADGTVTPIDTATDTAGAPFAVGVNPDQIAITPDGSRAYVTDNGANAVYPITLPALTVGAPITVGDGQGASTRHRHHPQRHEGLRRQQRDGRPERQRQRQHGHADHAGHQHRGHADRHGLPGLRPVERRRHPRFQDRLRDQLARRVSDRHGDRYPRGHAAGAARPGPPDRHRARPGPDRLVHGHERAARVGDRVRRLRFVGRRRDDRVLRMGLR